MNSVQLDYRGLRIHASRDALTHEQLTKLSHAISTDVIAISRGIPYKARKQIVRNLTQNGNDWLDHQMATDEPHEWATPVLVTVMMLAGECIPLLQNIESGARELMQERGAA